MRKFIMLIIAVAAALFVQAETIRQECPVYISKDKPIGSMRAGARVTVETRNGEWAKVRYECPDGFFIGFVLDSMLGPDAPVPEYALEFDTMTSTGSEPAREPPVPDPVPAKPRTAAGQQLKLAQNWKTQMTKGKLAVDDVRSIIASYADGPVDLGAPAESIDIYAGFTYQMPIKDALVKLNKTVYARDTVTCPGFPERSFLYCTFDNHYENCSKSILVTDIGGQVIGVQLVDESPHGCRLYGHTTKYRLYNFIQTKTKGNPKWAIAHRISQQSRVLVVESELVDANQQCKEYVKLYLAMPAVNVVAAVCGVSPQTARPVPMHQSPDLMRQGEFSYPVQWR